MEESERYIQRLLVTKPLMKPVYQEAIRILHLPQGSCGIDAGCGIGLQTPLLASGVGAEGHVIGLDVSPELIAKAEEIIDKAGLSEQISFQVGDIHHLPFDDNTYDWLWSANCAGYPSRNPLPLISELSRVVKPGGKVAILIYASQLLLPGYPILETRLSATSAGVAPFTTEMKPETHHLRVLGWFQEAGLDRCAVQTLVHGFHAPLKKEEREAVEALIEMRWEAVELELSSEDRVLFQRLTQPDSRDYILNIPDYYGFVVFSLFEGRVPR